MMRTSTRSSESTPLRRRAGRARRRRRSRSTRPAARSRGRRRRPPPAPCPRTCHRPGSATPNRAATQHQTWRCCWSSVRTQVVSAPAATSTTAPADGGITTPRGVVTSDVPPSPAWPAPLAPQHATVPLARTAQVWPRRRRPADRRPGGDVTVSRAAADVMQRCDGAITLQTWARNRAPSSPASVLVSVSVAPAAPVGGPGAAAVVAALPGDRQRARGGGHDVEAGRVAEHHFEVGRLAGDDRRRRRRRCGRHVDDHVVEPAVGQRAAVVQPRAPEGDADHRPAVPVAVDGGREVGRGLVPLREARPRVHRHRGPVLQHAVLGEAVPCVAPGTGH